MNFINLIEVARLELSYHGLLFCLTWLDCEATCHYLMKRNIIVSVHFVALSKENASALEASLSNPLRSTKILIWTSLNDTLTSNLEFSMCIDVSEKQLKDIKEESCSHASIKMTKLTSLQLI